MNETTCPTCGSPVKVVGNVTKHYEPIHAHDRSYIKLLNERDALMKEALAARAERDCYREALELIAASKRPDGSYNRCREACEQLASEAIAQGKKIREG